MKLKLPNLQVTIWNLVQKLDVLSLLIMFSIKVHIFWEGHKILWNPHPTLSVCIVDKSKVEISQNMAFSEYKNFTIQARQNLWLWMGKQGRFCKKSGIETVLPP